MATFTVNPGATAIDGEVHYSGFTQFYNLVSGFGGSTMAKDDSDANYRIYIGTTGSFISGEWEPVSRGILLFDVAASIAAGDMPVGAVVTAAEVSVYPNGTANNNFGGTELVLAAYDRTLLTDTTTLTTSDDFRNYRTVEIIEDPPATFNYYYMHPTNAEYGTTRKAYADVVSGTRIAFTLNATALAELNASITGSYPFHTSLLTNWDFDYDWSDYQDPTTGATNPTWVSNVEDSLSISSGRNATPSQRPQLNLTYYVGTGNATLEVVGQKASAGDTLEASFFHLEVFT